MKDDKHKSVILYAEWKKPLQNLSLEQKGRILDALLDFPDGIIPTFDDPVLQIAWSFMEGGLQENARKWEATRKKRSDAGKKGNESRWHSSKVDSTCRKNRICDTCDDSIANIAVSGSVSVSAEEESKEETAADSRTDSGLAEIVQRYEKTLGTFPRSALDKLKKWQDVYLQLLADGKAKDRYQAITGISIALHELAQTTGILVVALAQLNRNADRIVPSTADLKESGQLEQDADAVLLLVEKVVTNDGGESFQASLAKNKEGLTGTIPIWFDKERQRFLEIDARR